MISSLRRRKHTPDGQTSHVPVMPAWSIWAGAAVLLVVGILATFLLLALYGGGTPQDRIQLEIIKLAGSVVISSGGAAALFLAARRQRTTELDLAQRARATESNEHDATERRVTELYAAAAEQLGSDKAPVRMAGLYALERIGRENKVHRQTIIDLLCSYLRMPFSPEKLRKNEKPPVDISEMRHKEIRPEIAKVGAAGKLPVESESALGAFVGRQPYPGMSAQDDETLQEIEVRQTAQRLIVSHLHSDQQDADPERQFWENIDLDLSGTTLYRWSMDNCAVRSADFTSAYFAGGASFAGAGFYGGVSFSKSRFSEETTFRQAEFHANPWFTNTIFDGTANFASSGFLSEVVFRDVTFNGMLLFQSASFHEDATFHNAYFGKGGVFNGVDFYGFADFGESQLIEPANLHPALYHSGMWFAGSTFHSSSRFKNTYILARERGNEWQSIPDWEVTTVDGCTHDDYGRILMTLAPK